MLYSAFMTVYTLIFQYRLAQVVVGYWLLNKDDDDSVTGCKEFTKLWSVCQESCLVAVWWMSVSNWKQATLMVIHLRLNVWFVATLQHWCVCNSHVGNERLLLSCGNGEQTYGADLE